MINQHQKPRCDDANGVATITIDFLITYYRYVDIIEYMFAQTRGNINEYWIFLDSESSMNLIVNNNQLRNIQVAPNNTQMTVHCNAGQARTHMIGYLPGFGTI